MAAEGIYRSGIKPGRRIQNLCIPIRLVIVIRDGILIACQRNAVAVSTVCADLIPHTSVPAKLLPKPCFYHVTLCPTNGKHQITRHFFAEIKKISVLNYTNLCRITDGMADGRCSLRYKAIFLRIGIGGNQCTLPAVVRSSQPIPSGRISVQVDILGKLCLITVQRLRGIRITFAIQPAAVTDQRLHRSVLICQNKLCDHAAEIVRADQIDVEQPLIIQMHADDIVTVLDQVCDIVTVVIVGKRIGLCRSLPDKLPVDIQLIKIITRDIQLRTLQRLIRYPERLSEQRMDILNFRIKLPQSVMSVRSAGRQMVKPIRCDPVSAPSDCIGRNRSVSVGFVGCRHGSFPVS